MNSRYSRRERVVSRIFCFESGSTISSHRSNFARLYLPSLFFSFSLLYLPPRFFVSFSYLPTSVLLFHQDGSHDFRLKLNYQHFWSFYLLRYHILRSYPSPYAEVNVCNSETVNNTGNLLKSFLYLYIVQSVLKYLEIRNSSQLIVNEGRKRNEFSEITVSLISWTLTY